MEQNIPSTPTPEATDGTAKKFPKFLIPILIVVGVLVAGYFVLAKYQDMWPFEVVIAPTPSVSATPDEMAGWKTYRNDIYGYEIKYPNNWYVDTTYSNASITQRGPAENPDFFGGDTHWTNYPDANLYNPENVPPDLQDIFLIIESTDQNLTLDQLATKESDGIVEVTKIEDFQTKNGVSGKHIYIYSYDHPVGEHLSSVFKKNDMLFRFSLGSTGREIRELYIQILSTFKFIEPNKPDDTLCIQVITKARNIQTGEIKDFPTPCDVPDGWEKIDEGSIQ